MAEATLTRSPGVAQRTRSPSWPRLAAVYGGGAAAVAGLFAAGRALAPLDGPLALAGSIACGAAAMLLVGSLAEWAVHGRLMHGRHWLLRRIYDLHHRAHHWVHYRPDTYLRAEVTYVPLSAPPGRAARTRGEVLGAISAQALFYALFAAPPIAAGWLVTGSVAFVATLSLVAAGIIALAIHVHDAIHCPGHSPLERFGWFRRLDRHHYVHHVDTRANVNFLLPLGDLLLGTLRRDLSEAELRRWPTYEQARAVVHPTEAGIATS